MVSAVRRLGAAATANLDRRLMEIAAREKPQSVRGMYYQAIGAGLVDKDELGTRYNYMRIQRRILELRRSGVMPYSWITDGSRNVYGHTRYEGLEDFADYVAGLYRRDYWQDSPVRVEDGSRKTRWQANSPRSWSRSAA